MRNLVRECDLLNQRVLKNGTTGRFRTGEASGVLESGDRFTEAVKMCSFLAARRMRIPLAGCVMDLLNASTPDDACTRARFGAWQAAKMITIDNAN